MKKVVIYTKSNCPYCVKAKELLTERGVTYEEIDVEHDAEKLKVMMEKSGRRTVPQIFIGDQPIGGFDDLAALIKAQKLDDLLHS